MDCVTVGDMVSNLKQELGLLGRADFETAHPILVADLFYPEERVAVTVLGCVAYGCSVHAANPTSGWIQRIERNKKLLQAASERAREVGWVVLEYWECEVAGDPQAIALKILGVLSEKMETAVTSPEGWDEVSGGVRMARLARIDATTRMKSKAWDLFIQTVRDAAATEKGAFRRADVETVLIDGHKWEKARARDAWRTAMHHGLIRWTTRGVHPGPVFKSALVEAGLSKERGRGK